MYDGLKLLNSYTGDRPEVIIKYKNAEIEYNVDEKGGFVKYEKNGGTYLTAQMVYSPEDIISLKNILWNHL